MDVCDVVEIDEVVDQFQIGPQFVDNLQVDIKIEDNENGDIIIQDFPMEADVMKEEIEVFKEDDVKPFKCSVCSQSFSFHFFLEKHMVCHIDEPDKVFKCELCPEIFTSFETLQTHVLKNHSNLARFFTTTNEQLTIVEERKWNEANSKMLIELFSKYRGYVGSAKIKTLKQMWMIIAQELSTQFNIIVTASNVENRWRVLERSYKKFVEYEGTEKKFFEYAEEMGKLLKYKKPQIIVKNTTPSQPQQHQHYLIKHKHKLPTVSNLNTFKIHNTKEINKEVETKSIQNETKQKQYFKDRMNTFQRIQHARLKYERTRLSIEKEKLKLFKIRNDLLKVRNDILAKQCHKCHKCRCKD